MDLIKKEIVKRNSQVLAQSVTKVRFKENLENNNRPIYLSSAYKLHLSSGSYVSVAMVTQNLLLELVHQRLKRSLLNK